MTEEELEQQLVLSGKKLKKPLASVGELLSLIDRKNSLEKSASKTSTSDQSHLEETSNTKSKRKRGVVMEEQAKDPSNHDASSEKPLKRKAKMNLDSSSTHAKTEEPSKSLGIGAMGGKFKSSGVKSVGKNKDNDMDKCGGKSNESTPKAGTKSRGGRTISKSKDNKPNTGSNSLVESSKTD